MWQFEGKIYCEYIAPSPEAVSEQARPPGIPAHRNSEVALEINPGSFRLASPAPDGGCASPDIADRMELHEEATRGRSVDTLHRPPRADQFRAERRTR